MLAASVVWGSIPTWFLFVLAMFVAWRVSRGGAGSAVSELSKANEVLTKHNHDLGSEVRDLKIEVGKLETKTDISLALAPEVQRIVDRIGEHEEHAIERHRSQLAESAKQLVVLTMIADRLGPDTEGKAA